MAIEDQNLYIFGECLEHVMNTHHGPGAGESDRSSILEKITFLGGGVERETYNQKVTMSNYYVLGSTLS